MLKAATLLPLVLVLTSGAATAGVAQAAAPSQPSGAEAPLIRLGLISDSQLQTLNTPGQLATMRRPLDDRLVSVALRPPAVDKAGPYMMRGMLERLVDADVIVYTGDAANNGCGDEVEQAFGILREFRDRVGKPVFFVIGNHDYLGAGNTSDPKHRIPLCGNGNPPLTKAEVIEMAHRFNEENRPLMAARGWEYVDNFSEATTRACEAPGTRRVRVEDQHMKKGCYLAGVVTMPDGIQMVLLDTSDYADVNVPPTFIRSLFGLELAGLRGSISFDGAQSQGEWLKERLRGLPAPRIRLLASHYSLDHLRFNVQIVALGRVVGVPSQYLRPEPALGNRWFYGHTHIPQPEGSWYEDGLRYCVKGACSDTDETGSLKEEVNVGSTTDWWPHVAVASVGADSTRLDVRWMGDGCEPVLDLLFREAENREGRYSAVDGKRRGIVLFGIDRSYQGYGNGERDRSAAYQNLERLVSHTAGGSAAEASRMWQCLGHIGSWYEKVGGTPTPRAR